MSLLNLTIFKMTITAKHPIILLAIQFLEKYQYKTRLRVMHTDAKNLIFNTFVSMGQLQIDFIFPCANLSITSTKKGISIKLIENRKIIVTSHIKEKNFIMR